MFFLKEFLCCFIAEGRCCGEVGDVAVDVAEERRGLGVDRLALCVGQILGDVGERFLGVCLVGMVEACAASLLARFGSR